MSDQQSLGKTGVDDSISNVVQIIGENSVGNTEKDSNDLKLSGAGNDAEPKKTTRFQITSIKSDYVETRPDTERLLGEQQSADNVGVFEANNSTSRTDTTASNNVQPKKKISFQVTSIESTEGRSRGDSNGYDDIDELNESEFLEEEETALESTLAHSGGNGNGTSRFKVVKIPRYDSKPYYRGRWRCWDFVKCPPPSVEQILAELPGNEINDRADHEPGGSTRSLLTSSASGGAVFKPVDVTFEISSQDNNSQSETKLTDEKGAVLASGETVGKPDTKQDFVINNLSGPPENPESLSNESEGDVADEDTFGSLSEDERVAEKIKIAMNQVVQIKTHLLKDVNADVKKLKQTIQQLTSENQRLREENESLKQRLSNQPKTESN